MNDALKILEENNGVNYVPIYVPSLKRNVTFKPLTIGKIKSISKMLLENDNISDLGIILTSMMLDLCTEKLDLESICEIDRLRILLELRRFNNLSENVFSIKCSNKECDHKINYNVNIGDLSEKFNVVPENTTKEFTNNGVSYKIEFGLPSLSLIIKYKQFIETTKAVLLKDGTQFSKDDMYKIEFYLIKYSNLLYIKNIQINNSYIEGFVESSIVDRNKLIDNLPPAILDYIKQEIIKTEKYDIPLILDDERACPKCKEGRLKIKLDIDDFFLI